jgi:major membrane immunogen (membrane-anchored lipoprotein)
MLLFESNTFSLDKVLAEIVDFRKLNGILKSQGAEKTQKNKYTKGTYNYMPNRA